MEASMFTGSGVALVTPFLGGEIDFEAFGSLIDWQIESGTDALIICGTTGEPSTMARAEKEAAIEFAVKRTAGRVPVFAGTGGNDTREAIELSVRAEELGADGLLMVTPYYNKTTQAGLVAHFYAVADRVNIPIILYNVPSRTGLNLLPATAAKLTEHKNIRGVKEASANIEQITELMRQCGDRIALYSGNDDHVVPLMALGGQGVISVTANVVPRMMHDMAAAWRNGDHDASLALQFRLNPLTKQLFTEVNPIPVKAALAMMGKISPEIRLPLVPLSEPNRGPLERELRALNLI